MDTCQGTAHVTPLEPGQAVEVRYILDLAQTFGGYVPASLRVMAHKPAILRAFSGLIQAVSRTPGEVPLELK